MAKSWAEVSSSPQFQALDDVRKEAARNQYFDQVVAPRAPKDKIDDIRRQFDKATRTKESYREMIPEHQDTETQGVLRNVVGAVAEPVAQLATGAVAAPIAGIAGAVAAPFVGGERASEIVQGVQGAMTYQPRTVAGQAVSGAIAKPFEMLGDIAKSAGQKAQDMGASPVVATGIETAVNMLPSLIIPMLKSKGGASVNAQAVADQAAIKAGLDPAKIPAQIRKQLVAIAQQSVQKAQNLDPVALEREARMASHPVPVKATSAQITRDPVKYGLERDIAGTESGRPIRQVQVEQNRQLQQNLDVLRGKTGAKFAPGESEAAGGYVQKVERLKLNEQKREVRKLYKQADKAGELGEKVDTSPIVDLLNKQKAMDEFKRTGQMPTTEQAPKGKTFATLKEIEEMRKDAVRDARNPTSPNFKQASDLISAIDQITEGKGGSLYKKARAARRAQGEEFERTGAVSKLVSERKGMQDRQVALEDTWRKTVLGGTIQDLRNVIKSLNSGSKRVRSAGAQAVKELAGQTVDYIKSEATSGAAKMETGELNFSHAKFKSAVEKVGRPKLEQLIGKENTDELFRLVETSGDVMTEPPSRITGSPTVPKALRFLDALSNLPGVSHVGGLLSSGARKAHQIASAKGIAREAVTTPLERAATPSQFTLSSLGKKGLKGAASSDVQASEQQ